MPSSGRGHFLSPAFSLEAQALQRPKAAPQGWFCWEKPQPKCVYQQLRARLGFKSKMTKKCPMGCPERMHPTARLGLTGREAEAKLQLPRSVTAADHRPCSLRSGSHQRRSQVTPRPGTLKYVAVLSFPSPAACSMALTGTAGTPQPRHGPCGWSQQLAWSLPSSQPPAVFGNELHSSRVLFSLGILRNLYLFAQCQLDVCPST